MISESFQKSFSGKRVLVTGHTGFKGAWLSLWLKALGAHVIGYSLPPPTTPSLFALSRLEQEIVHLQGDIRDYPRLENALAEHQPHLVFHLAAQPIVLDSYTSPKETFDINAGGTVNLLEAIRKVGCVEACVIVTTDKCYKNVEWIWGYRENDTLGGDDPYSASKAQAELAVASYRQSFFKNGRTAVATARAGNVIGGGDFSPFRIVPDIMKALSEGVPVPLRNPSSIRPWLYILDALNGYLTLAAAMLKEPSQFAEEWNFGPKDLEPITVQTLVDKAIKRWGEGSFVNHAVKDAPPEMGRLCLNWEKAAAKLQYKPVFTFDEAIAHTVDWHRAYTRYLEKQNDWGVKNICLTHISLYTTHAEKQNHPLAAKQWAVS